MTEILPPEARTEHVAILLILIYQNDLYQDSKSLMKTARITNKQTFYKCVNDLKNWGIITQNGRYGRLQIVTSDKFGRLQNVTSLNGSQQGKLQNVTSNNDIKESDRLQIVTSDKFGKLQNVTSLNGYRLQNVTSLNEYRDTKKNVDNSITHSNTEDYEQKKLSPHVRTSHEHTHAGTELVNLLTQEKEKRGLGKEEKTFAQSEIARWEDFQNTFSTPEFAGVDIRHYYDKLRFWMSNNEPAKSKNWTNTARSIMRNDWKTGNLKRLQNQSYK